MSSIRRICDNQAEIRNGYLTYTILQHEPNQNILGYNNIRHAST